MKNVHKWEYFTIHVCSGYAEVGYSPLYIYYELLVIALSLEVQLLWKALNGIFKDIIIHH